MENTTSIKLRRHAETSQMEADELAYKLYNLQEIIFLLAPVQSICDFNLFWLYSTGPNVIIHDKTLEFLKSHIIEFKRKLKLVEIIEFDSIITNNKIEDFSHFKSIVKRIRHKNNMQKNNQ